MRNQFRAGGMAAALLWLGTATCLAGSSSVETVVVTSARAHYGAPHIYILKRADQVITTVQVTCDTRDKKQRLRELKQTVRNMMDKAEASKTISLGTGDSVITDLDPDNLDDLISPDTRPDTSQLELVIKTKVSDSDTMKSATQRIKDFIDGIVKMGRTEVIRPGDRWDLTIVGPEQYRDQLVTKIVEDAKHTAQLFGAGYAVEVDGLEEPVSWYQKDALDMALYVPYTLRLVPVRSASGS